MLPCDPLYIAKQLELRIKGWFCGFKPIALHVGAMDPERASDRVPKLSGFKLILAREYFDAVRFVPFDCDAEKACDIQNLETA